jgi:hypothetical protein
MEVRRVSGHTIADTIWLLCEMPLNAECARSPTWPPTLIPIQRCKKIPHVIPRPEVPLGDQVVRNVIFIGYVSNISQASELLVGRTGKQKFLRKTIAESLLFFGSASRYASRHAHAAVEERVYQLMRYRQPSYAPRKVGIVDDPKPTLFVRQWDKKAKRKLRQARPEA